MNFLKDLDADFYETKTDYESGSFVTYYKKPDLDSKISSIDFEVGLPVVVSNSLNITIVDFETPIEPSSFESTNGSDIQTFEGGVLVAIINR